MSVRLSVCLSVRPSVTFVYCIPTAERQTSSQSGSPIILVFLTPSAGTQFQGEPPSEGAQNTWALEKICDFPLKSVTVYLGNGTIEIGPWLLWNVNRK